MGAGQRGAGAVRGGQRHSCAERATLTIEAGTTVFMGPETRFTVQSGALVAVGTPAAPIRITSHKVQSAPAGAPGDWQQLTFGAGTTSRTRLEHVRVEYGHGIVVAGSAPTFNFLDVRYNAGPAVSLDLAASPAGVGNQASGNAANAVVVPGGEIRGTVNWALRGIPYLVESGSLSVGEAPKIAALAPARLQRGETKTFTLSGARLEGLSAPRFDWPGLGAEVLAGGSASQAQLKVSAAADAALGAATLTAQTDAGEVSLLNALTLLASQPVLDSVAPTILSVGQGEASVTLRGQNFTRETTAYLDADALATSYVGATELNALVPNQTLAGVRALTLKTPDPEGGAPFVSNAQTLTFITPPPVVTAVTPKGLRRGETVALKVDGSGAVY